MTNVRYNPQQLRLVYISRGSFLVEEQGLSGWDSGIIDNQKGLASNIIGTRSNQFSGNEITLFRLNFVVVGTGTGQVELENLKVLSSKGNELPCNITPLKYSIEEGKD
jgi:hypothetical protein